ncbi:MAG: hypothetical protein V1928_01570 [Parcubacteria group bacterium]
MGQLRFNEKAFADFESAEKSHDPKKALELILRWVGKPIMEEQVVAKYNSHDGEPEKMKWVSYEAWDGKLWIGGFSNSPNIDSKSALSKFLRKEIKSGEIVVMDGIMIEHVPEVGSIEGAAPEHFRFIKLRELSFS